MSATAGANVLKGHIVHTNVVGQQSPNSNPETNKSKSEVEQQHQKQQIFLP
jgi:hypothetical protein